MKKKLLTALLASSLMFGSVSNSVLAVTLNESTGETTTETQSTEEVLNTFETEEKSVENVQQSEETMEKSTQEQPIVVPDSPKIDGTGVELPNLKVWNPSREDFIVRLSQYAAPKSDQAGLYTSVLMAQAILESNFGTSELAKNAQNYFGIKGDYRGDFYEHVTTEEINGQLVQIKDRFRKYPNLESSVDDYINKIKNGVSWQPNRYQGAWKINAPTYREATKALTGTYATDSNYHLKLNQIIEAYGLTKYDQQTRINLDVPADHQGIKEETTVIRGWALGKTPTKKVAVYVDNQPMGEAKKDVSRPDVASAFPDYHNEQSGFELNVDANKMPEGDHYIKVVAEFTNGEQAAVQRHVVRQVEKPLLTVDTPQNNMTIGKKDVTISGWALDTQGISRVSVYLDGTYVGDATYGLARPDVQQAYPSYANGRSGYELILPANKLTNGQHQIEIKAINGQNRITSKLIKINKTTLPHLLEVDQPKNNASVRQAVAVSGWTLAEEKIKDVTIYVDGVKQGKATMDIARPDVQQIFPQYGIEKSGYHYQLDVSKLSTGTHRLKVVSTKENGQQVASERVIKKEAPRVYQTIDTPRAQSVVSGNQLKLSGWLLSDLPVTSLNVTINGKVIKALNRNIERPDVHAVFPDFTKQTAGYHVNVPTASMKKGSNKVGIQVKTSDGKVQTFSQTVEKRVLPSVMNIDFPNKNKNYQGNVKVSGWALTNQENSQVDFYVNNQLVKSGKLKLARPDVNAVYPLYNDTNPGFEEVLPAKHFKEGKNVVRVDVKQGNTVLTTSKVEVNYQSNILVQVDTPTNNQKVTGANFKMSGWVLADTKVSQITVEKDGKKIADLNKNVARPDVNAIYPEYADSTPGYTGTFDTRGWKAGKHTLTIIVKLDNGQTKRSTVTVTKPSLPDLLQLDYPSANSKQGDQLTVSVWYLSEWGAKDIQVLIDNQLVETISQFSARPDVNTVYPDYHELKSGYSTSLSLANVKPGKHTVKVIAKSRENKVIETSRTFVKTALTPIHDLDKRPVKATNQRLKLSGWFLDRQTTKGLNVYVGNEKIGTGSIGIARPDVAKLYPEYKNSNAGFAVDLPLTKMSGIETLRLDFVMADGSIIQRTEKVEIEKYPILHTIDTRLSSVSNTSIPVTGWVLADEGVDRIEVKVDGKKFNNAQINISRPDVQSAYPQYGQATSGFHTVIDLSQVANGNHTLELMVVTKRQRVKVIKQTVTVGRLAGKKIYVDAGHGGKDPGARYSGINEKDLNLSVALKVQARLKQLGAEVVMSRETDVFLELREISAKANASKADIFVSIHHNSSPSSSVNGIEVYSFGMSRTKAANLENTQYNDANSITPELPSMRLNPQLRVDRLVLSKQLSSNVQQALIRHTGAVNRGAKTQNFHVVRETNMPAILAELGFMSNPIELNRLVNPGYQNQLAEGIVQGILGYYQV
ncbi:N-acetylmuramoyl-L-alanine amidase [Vagococcus lutrae]|uniref:N-acetylmuramoyl-L-alanine amidase n=1 Tax=Vagococcus lutrae TaxID=81947 RepID=UPI00144455F4|nr:N-acetylmuramoyl-L-alanine amidase [Vagococcus lutrae]NKZ28124.1 hypothetical protein [Vagococcus lutrae]